MTANEYQGGCYCGNLQLKLSSTLAIPDLQPRACDCRFCRKHDAAWISDARGTLHVSSSEPQAVSRFRQGSSAAEFLLCQRCGVLAAVLYRPDDGCFAAVNSKAIDTAQPFPPAVCASPQKLGKSEKIARWRSLWIPKVLLSPGFLPA